MGVSTNIFKANCITQVMNFYLSLCWKKKKNVKMSDFFNVLVAKLHKQVFFLLLYGTVLSSSITLINLATFILFDPFCFDRKKTRDSVIIQRPSAVLFDKSSFIRIFSTLQEFILQKSRNLVLLKNEFCNIFASKENYRVLQEIFELATRFC